MRYTNYNKRYVEGLPKHVGRLRNLCVLLMVCNSLILIDWLIVGYTVKYAYIEGTMTKTVGWVTEESGFDSQLGQRTFCGTQPAFYSTVIRARLWCEVDLLPPSSAEGNNECCYMPIPHVLSRLAQGQLYIYL